MVAIGALLALLSLGGGGDVAQGATGAMEMFAYFNEVIEARRAEPRDDVISRLVHESGDGEDPLTVPELIAFAVLLLVHASGGVSSGLATLLILPAGATAAIVKRFQSDLLAEYASGLVQPIDCRLGAQPHLVPECFILATHWARDGDVQTVGRGIWALGLLACRQGQQQHD